MYIRYFHYKRNIVLTYRKNSDNRFETSNDTAHQQHERGSKRLKKKKNKHTREVYYLLFITVKEHNYV